MTTRQQLNDDALVYELETQAALEAVFGPIVGRCLSEQFLSDCDEDGVFVPFAVHSA
jgi:hypothetical protein